MPNHISNRLTFSGDTDVIKDLLNFIKTEHPETQKSSSFGDALVFSKNKSFGYLYTKKCEFLIQDENTKSTVIKPVTSAPDGWVPVIETAWTQYIDFNNIIPTPKCVEQGDNLKKYKNRNWFDFNSKMWNTKWNAYSTYFSKKGHLFFTTAWDYPKLVIERLSWLYPEIVIKLDTNNEGGWFCGTGIFQNGELVENNIKSSKEYTSIERKRINDIFRTR